MALLIQLVGLLLSWRLQEDSMVYTRHPVSFLGMYSYTLKTFGGVLVTHTSTVQLLLIVIHVCFIKVLAQILTTEKFPHSLDLILGSFRKFAMRLVNDYIFKLNYIHIIFKV